MNVHVFKMENIKYSDAAASILTFDISSKCFLGSNIADPIKIIFFLSVLTRIIKNFLPENF